MEPCLATNDKLMFYKYLDKSSIYFEYGSGGSTYQASIRNNVLKIYSVESDNTWYENVKQLVKSDNFTYFYNEMDTIPKKWGYPGPNSTISQHIKYSNYIRNLSELEKKSVDLILIDGRFRVACCLKCFDCISEECLIAFDDFLDRPNYHVVLDYYDVVDKTIDNRMVILCKKKTIFVPCALIEEYEKIPD
jgi:hypothetical protein